MIDNPTINNKSKIGTGENSIDELNKETKFLYNNGKKFKKILNIDIKSNSYTSGLCLKI